ncbi:MAG: 4-alpha-glucanotransferase [Myxococcota bacterium]
MKLARSSGVLLHPTSLPGPFGVGDMGAEARRFVDLLAKAGQTWWQILPLNAPGYGGSPYSAVSAFAGNPMLIDPLALHERGWASDDDLETLRVAVDPGATRVEFQRVTQAKGAYLRAVYEGFCESASTREQEGFDVFCEEQGAWLEDYAMFSALKRARGGSWRDWGEAIVQHSVEALDAVAREHGDEIDFVMFTQWVFFTQWNALRGYAAQRNVRFIGDIPIFVAMDSADVWADRGVFLVDEAGRAEAVAGVPPDYFSETGQKWGNPLYNWAALQEEDYAWWIERVEATREMVDLMRIDHFRGFEAYWAIPADAPTAETGAWEKAPGDALLSALKADLGQLPLIAEDLGVITAEVEALRDRYAIPGMKVMQFAFNGDPNHPFLPHTYPDHCVAYLGTHDNDTTRGWYDALAEHDKHHVRVYLSSPDEAVVQGMLGKLLESRASRVIVTPQDLFALGSDARMNTPGTPRDNWRWRLDPRCVEDERPWMELRARTERTRRI